MTSTERKFTSVEICAGAGGQAVGLHEALFKHLALIEIDKHAVATLEENVKDNAEWDGCQVIEADLTELSPVKLRLDLGLEPGELDLLAGGVPCPPFSVAGKQLGQDDERDLFPTMLNLVDELKPKAVMIENVRGLLDQKFKSYREDVILKRLDSMEYELCYWKVLEAKDYGVPQLRPRAILVAIRKKYAKHFLWNEPEKRPVRTVGDALRETMWSRFDAVDDPRAEAAYDLWLKKASKGVAPTLVGGSKKHGGADLGPTRAKKAWGDLGVCGLGVANKPEEMTDPDRDLFAAAGPKLTVRQAATIQGFPEDWQFPGKKTATYRQVGNAFPPPVARAVGEQIRAALEAAGVKARKPELLSSVPAPSVPTGAEPADRSSDLEGAFAG
ncbi:DNA cytosine methyltransferase [Streptomyces sp. ISL-96]|uniref:DNA cytosine methyltransferase n=1 Tax=Streptomyces sp. ISL-96 TaxID=2819191 RepID=UPI001BEB5879|nr:DNA cytosine methyltransferase [Streptomyces sp. ISL-96]MBT2488057.1 DNA cytosine methyltransferase [Streptomyces sp. ISL-96]